MSASPARIELLDPALVDQIAAGEVVERPASALKELLDNAVDAESTRIDVELQGGGKTLVRVCDNGKGIHPEDLPLCVLRHATSKIRSADQLLSLATLGFRGEALSSLAAVAKLQIKSRRADDPLGRELYSEPNSAPKIEQVGMPRGTQVRISGLFAQIPARLKFLRAEATEQAHCVEVVTQVALLHPHIAFSLRCGERMALELPVSQQGQRIAQILGRRAPGPLWHFDEEQEGMRVQGWFAPFDRGVRSRNSMYIAVRGRVIRDRTISRIVRESLAEKLPDQRSPVGLIILSPPEDQVDVNVHPQKCEVRFSDAQRVYFGLRAILHRVLQRESQAPQAPAAEPSPGGGQALRRAALLSKIESSHKQAHLAETHDSIAPRQSGRPRSYRLATRAHHQENYAQAKQSLRDEAQALRSAALREEQEKNILPSQGRAQAQFAWATGTKGAARKTETAPPQILNRSSQSRQTTSPSTQVEAQAVLAQQEGREERPSEELEVLSVLPGPVALCREGDRLLVVDLLKLRAHLILARLRRQWHQRGALDAQRLLHPLLLNPDPQAMRSYLEHRSTLATLGFELESFGEGALRVLSVPAVMGPVDEVQAVAEQLEKFRPWLRMLGGLNSDSPPLELICELPTQDPAPRLARRWIQELRAQCDLAEVPGLHYWTADELARR